MSKLRTPFRFDYVGSFLRPAKLKEAKADFKAGKITEAEAQELIDQLIIAENAERLKAAGEEA